MQTIRRLSAAGLATEVSVSGPEDAPAVLLLHGGGIDRAAMCWHEMTPRLLAAGQRVIAPDLPGYGGTEGFGRPHRVADLGHWAAEVIAACAAGPVAAIGCSMGGATALWLALERPEMLRAVVPIGSYGLARRAALHPLIALWLKTGGGRLAPKLAAGSDLGARVLQSMIFTDPRRVSAAMVRAFRSEAQGQADRQSFRDFLLGEVQPWRFATCFRDRLAGLTMPALFVHGRFDPLVACRHARRAAGLAPDAGFLSVTAGHWPHRERPEIVGPALLDFLARRGH